MKPILLIDFGSTYTKLTAVDIENEIIMATTKSFTTVDTDINDGLSDALSQLYQITGKCDFEETFACSSAAGGLKMIAVGLVPDLTAEAARKASLNAGAKVLKVFSFELNETDIQEISSLKPDIVLLTGGTDGGNKSVILHNAKSLALIKAHFPIIIAGNRSVSHEVCAILTAGGKDAIICDNVMPEFNVLNIEPAKECIRNLFLDRIIRAKGLSKVTALIEGILMPTPSAVLKATTLLSKGHGLETGIGELILVDVGGATTDVYSIASGAPTRSVVSFKGLPEPFEKRTVEGDLGVRYSADFLAEETGLTKLSQKSGIDDSKVSDYLDKIKNNPSILPENTEFQMLDFSLAYYAVRIAANRHVGKVEIHYTVNGVVFSQNGKDLTGIKTIVGTGGPVINSINPTGVLEGIIAQEGEENMLKPTNATFYLDKEYIFAAMGLLAEKYPKVALRILKKSISKI